MPYAELPHIRLYYEIEGRGHPLILITGYMGDMSNWDGIKKFLAKDFQLVLFDNRCSGRSDSPDSPFTLQQMAEDTIALADHLKLRKPHVLGQSMGSTIAQLIAYHHPGKINKAVYSQTFLKIYPVGEAAARFWIKLREDDVSVRRQTEAIMPWIFSNEFMADRKKCEELIAKAEKQPSSQTLAGQKRQFEALMGFDSTSWCEKISVPSLIIGGDEDILCPPKDCHYLAKKIPGAKLHMFPHMGHMAYQEKPEGFSRVVSEFLKD